AGLWVSVGQIERLEVGRGGRVLVAVGGLHVAESGHGREGDSEERAEGHVRCRRAALRSARSHSSQTRAAGCPCARSGAVTSLRALAVMCCLVSLAGCSRKQETAHPTPPPPAPRAR